jgi:hypothetical protein
MGYRTKDIAVSLSRIAEELVSPASEFPVVTLYHGSFLSNLDSIKGMGIVPRAVDAEATVGRAVDEVSGVLVLSEAQKRELYEGTAKYAIDRIKQSKFDKVYLSGEKSFAESNAKAGGEWYEQLVSSALRIVHEDYYEMEHDYAVRTLDLEKKMKMQDEKLREMQRQDMGSETQHEERLVQVRLSRELDRQYDELRKERSRVLDGRRREVGRQEQEVLKKRFGDEAVIFTVEMPYDVFVEKIASFDSKQRIQLFESMYSDYVSGVKTQNWFEHIRGDSSRVWEFFQEVHLSGVESRFIVKWETMK